MRMVIAFVMCAACAGSQVPTTTTAATTVAPTAARVAPPAATAKVTLHVRSTGLFLGDKVVVGPDKLRSPDAVATALKATPPEVVVFDIDDEPAPAAYATLAALRGAKVELRRRTRDGQERAIGMNVTHQLVDDRVVLSIEVLRDRVILGLSRVNEFHHIANTASGAPDFERLAKAIDAHKQTAFFADRSDIELAVAADVPSHVLLSLAELVARIGFTDVAIVDAEYVSAKAPPATVVDVSRLKTAAQVLAKLNEHAGTEAAGAVTLRASSGEICPRLDVWAKREASVQHVVLVRAKAPVWIAFGMAHLAESGSYQRKEAALDQVQATLARNLENPFVTDVPVSLAAEPRVDAATFLGVLRAVCASGVTNVTVVTSPAALPFKP